MNVVNPVEISVVVPTYKSHEWIYSFIVSLDEVLALHFMSYEVIAVNDGNDETTYLELQRLDKSCLQIVNSSKRLGQHQATWIGIQQAKGKVVVTIDDDGEFPPIEIITLYKNYLKLGSDIVYGIPNSLKSGGLKTIFYKLYLMNLERRNEARKSSFRMVSNMLLKSASYKPLSMLNLDVYLAELTTSILFVSVQYEPGNRGRYSIFNYFYVLLKAMYYKQVVNFRKQ
jgi:glycosyltransferase involved in cell wall biosynthesis